MIAGGMTLTGAFASVPFALAEWQTSQLSDRPGPSPDTSVPKEGTPATVIDDQDVDGILGKNVRSVADEDMGRIVDILVSKDGQVRAVVIDFGGFLGVGSRKIAVDWTALRFPGSGKLDRMTVDLTRDQVRVAPEYRPGAPIVVLGTPSYATRANDLGADIREVGVPSPHAEAARAEFEAGTMYGGRHVGGRPCRSSGAKTISRLIPPAEANVDWIGSSSFSPTCRWVSVRSSPSI